MFRQKSSQVRDEGAGRHGPLQPHLEGGARRGVELLAVPQMGPLLAVRLSMKVHVAVSSLELEQRFQLSDFPHHLRFYECLTDEINGIKEDRKLKFRTLILDDWSRETSVHSSSKS